MCSEQPLKEKYSICKSLQIQLDQPRTVLRNKTKQNKQKNQTKAKVHNSTSFSSSGYLQSVTVLHWRKSSFDWIGFFYDHTAKNSPFLHHPL